MSDHRRVAVPHFTMRADGTVVQNVPTRAPDRDAAPMHDAAAHAAITAELVACTLGARKRPELRVDLAGRLSHLMAQGVVHLRDAFRKVARELASYSYPRAR